MGTMNALNILITSASRKVSLVKSFQQALKDEGLGGFVVVADSSPDSASMKFADISTLVPSLPNNGDESDFYGGILDICNRMGIGLIVPTRDGELEFFSKHKAFFGEMGIFVAICDCDTVALCQDKLAFYDFCISNNFSVPQKIDDVTRLPVFVKARNGHGGNSAARADSLPELFSLRRRYGESITQENINAPEYTIDVFSDSNSKVLSVVPRQRIKIMGGESWVGRTEKNADIMQESQRLAEALRLKYHSVIQCFYDAGIVKFIEVNPRFGGASNCSFVAGANSPRWLVQLATGRDVTAPPIGDFLDNLTMLRYSQDTFVYPETNDETRPERPV